MDLAHDLFEPTRRPDVDRPTIVLLHGLSSSRETYSDVIPTIVEHGHRVCNADLRGHGETGPAPSYTVALYAQDVAELIRSRLGGDPAIIVGHSLGGLTASTLAASDPELVHAMLLEDPPLFEGDDTIRAASPAAGFFPLFVAKVRGWQEGGYSAEDVATALGRQPSPHGGTVEERNGAETCRAQARALLAFDPAAMDAAIDGTMWTDYDPLTPPPCPVTVLRADPAIGAVFQPDQAERFAEAIPHANIEMVAGAAHRIHNDPAGTEPYLAALIRFLDSLA